MSYCWKKNVTQQFIIFKTCSTLKLNFFIRFHTLKVIGPPGYLNRMVMPHSSADAEIQTHFVRHTGLPFHWDPCYELYKCGEEDTDLTSPTFVLWHPKSLQDFRVTKRFAATSLSELHKAASHGVSWYVNYVGLVQPHHPGFDTAAQVLKAFADAVPVVSVWWYAILDLLGLSILDN